MFGQPLGSMLPIIDGIWGIVIWCGAEIPICKGIPGPERSGFNIMVCQEFKRNMKMFSNYRGFLFDGKCPKP